MLRPSLMVFFIQFVTLRCFLFPLPPQTWKIYLRGTEYMGLCCWRDCSALANDHLHSCHTRSQDQHWPPSPFQAGHHCSPAFCQCTCVLECISAFPIASPKTASQYLDYERGASIFTIPQGMDRSDCVGDDLPPNQRCRGSRLTQCGLTAHHDNLLTAQRRSLIQSFVLLRTQRTHGSSVGPTYSTTCFMWNSHLWGVFLALWSQI